MTFSAQENNEKISKALAFAALEQSIEFNSSHYGRNVAVFRDPVDEFTGGRIRFFQRAIFSQVGAYPDIVKTVPSCLKVFFTIEGLNLRGRGVLEEYFTTELYDRLCAEVDISYVQFSGKIYHPK